MSQVRLEERVTTLPKRAITCARLFHFLSRDNFRMRIQYKNVRIIINVALLYAFTARRLHHYSGTCSKLLRTSRVTVFGPSSQTLRLSLSLSLTHSLTLAEGVIVNKNSVRIQPGFSARLFTEDLKMRKGNSF